MLNLPTFPYVSPFTAALQTFLHSKLSLSIEELGFLVGTWSGTGHAEYPTIQPVEYLEELTFSVNEKDPVIHVEQKTWIESTDAKAREPLFWESGFLIDKGSGIFELVSAQKSGRMEVLRGKARRMDPNTIELPLMSVSIVNDDRMIRSGRTLTFSPEKLYYELNMSTTANPSFQRHVAALLTKSTGH